MARDPQPNSPLFTQIDITAGSQSLASSGTAVHDEQTELLRQILAAMDRQSELLEEMVANANSAQRQRTVELKQWREANPVLAESCREAAEALAQVQAEFLRNLTEEVQENGEQMAEGEFVFNEFVDRFGPRLAHLNGVLQMLGQLSSVNSAEDAPAEG